MNELYIPMLKRRHGWDDERLRRGEESPTKVKQYHAQRAELLSMVESLKARVEELTDELSTCKRRYNELYEAGIKLTSEYKKRAALKQGGTGIQDMMAEVEALKQEPE